MESLPLAFCKGNFYNVFMKKILLAVVVMLMGSWGCVLDNEDGFSEDEFSGPLDEMLYMFCEESGCRLKRIPLKDLYLPAGEVDTNNSQTWQRLCGGTTEDPSVWIGEKDFIMWRTYCVIDSYFYCSMPRVEATRVSHFLIEQEACQFPPTPDTLPAVLP